MVSAKVRASVTAAILFFIVANPVVYRLVDGLLGGVVGRIASPSGCPTTWGLVVHSAVFGLAAYASMKA
jgi:hypothetical protein